MPAETQPANPDQELKGLVVDMLKAGKSDAEVAKYIQTYDDVRHPIRAVMSGAGEGMISGVVNGVIGLPMMIRDAVMDTIDVLQGEEPKHAKAFLDGLHDLLPTLRDAGPREQARMVADLVTSVGIGIGEGRVATSKPVVRGVGRGLEYAGEHPFAARMTGAAGVVGGITRGDPAMVAGGVVGMMTPPALSAIGKRLVRMGGGVPRDEQALQSQFADTVRSELNRNVQGAVRLGDKTLRGKLSDLDKNIATTERDASNARQLAKIQDAAEGMQEGQPTISRSVSAQTPEGQRMSMSVRLKPTGESTDPVDDLTRRLKRGNPGITDADARRLAERLNAASSPVAVRLPVTPTGKATADLAGAAPVAAPGSPRLVVDESSLPASWRPSASSAGTPPATQRAREGVGTGPMNLTGAPLEFTEPATSMKEFVDLVDQMMTDVPSKSKAASGWTSLSENDLQTVLNAWSSGVRTPAEVREVIAQKRLNRQADHVGNYYLNKREVPDN